MSSPSTIAEKSPSKGLPLSPTGPLLFWLTLQLLTLCLPVFQIPLSDQYPRPAEKLALDQLILGHLIFSSLFFPFLFRSWSSGILLTISTWPFIQIAASLSAIPGRTTLIVGSYVTLWLFALTVWGNVAKERRTRHAIGALATLLTLMGPTFWYLQAEYGGASSEGFITTLFAISPSLAALQLNRAEHFQLTLFVLPITLLLAGTILSFSRQVFPKLSTAPSAENGG